MFKGTSASSHKQRISYPVFFANWCQTLSHMYKGFNYHSKYEYKFKTNSLMPDMNMI